MKKTEEDKKNYLVIVESPTKAKTITRMLGKEFHVVSSMGHIIDLPRKKIGVDIEHNFSPTYEVITGKKKILMELKKESSRAKKIYLATDYDREGEAISWHLREELKNKNKEFLRVAFHEITKEAIKEAFDKPGEINMNLVNAQQARRVLDRLVGYKLSPLLWRKIVRGLSAGRVQSVALRLIVERECLIRAFIPEEYWEVEAELIKKEVAVSEANIFKAKLDQVDGKDIELKNKDEAERTVNSLKDAEFKVRDIRQKEKKLNPAPPFITSTLQQEAFNKLRFNTRKTMFIAQQLYEGIELGQAGPVGLITYMRTDSVNVAQSAIQAVRKFIQDVYGKEYLPAQPNIYKSKKTAQEAHEAIRPTSVSRKPEEIKEFLTPEQLGLYELIYKRFIASQMTPARYLQTTVEIEAKNCLFLSHGLAVLFKGFKIIYDDSEKELTLPNLFKGEVLRLINLIPSQHFTKPPPRFSEGTLVKMLEEKGIGRPSTYAPIINTLILRDYVRRIKGYLQPTDLGEKVCDLLVENFSEIMDVGFTAQMETQLDDIGEGKNNWVSVVRDFYLPFSKTLDLADKNIKKEVVATDKICERCGRPMVIKWGRRGRFLSCSGFPECKNALSITTGIKCPEKDCPGELIERRSKRGIFYGCSQFPKCKYLTNKLPV